MSVVVLEHFPGIAYCYQHHSTEYRRACRLQTSGKTVRHLPRLPPFLLAISGYFLLNYFEHSPKVRVIDASHVEVMGSQDADQAIIPGS